MSRGCRRFAASRVIISSSTAHHLKCCGISMAWCATVADLDRQSAPRRTASCRGGSMSEGLEYGRISFEFAEEVDRLSDPDDVANSLRRIMTPFGLELYGFFARVPGPGERLDTIAFNKQTSGLAEWLKLYDDGRYAEIDPVMRRLNQTATPFGHDEVSYDLDPRAAGLKHGRRDFGFASGFSVPIFGSTGRNGFVSYGIFKGPKPDLP